MEEMVDPIEGIPIALRCFVQEARASASLFGEAWLVAQQEQGEGAFPTDLTEEEWVKHFVNFLIKGRISPHRRKEPPWSPT